MLSTVPVPARGHVNVPPNLLFRGSPAQPGALSLSPLDCDRFKRGGARNKLRIGNFLTFTGSPGIWGPSSTNSSLLATGLVGTRSPYGACESVVAPGRSPGAIRTANPNPNAAPWIIIKRWRPTLMLPARNVKKPVFSSATTTTTSNLRRKGVNIRMISC